jgi:hypothetical protein
MGGGDLSGIGLLAANVLQENDLMLHSQGGSFHEPPAEIMNDNSYLSNSSVAKTAVHKRRNMPISPN